MRISSQHVRAAFDVRTLLRKRSLILATRAPGEVVPLPPTPRLCGLDSLGYATLYWLNGTGAARSSGLRAARSRIVPNLNHFNEVDKGRSFRPLRRI
jgi:hypothetical protein